MTDPSEASNPDTLPGERPGGRDDAFATGGGLLAVGWLCLPALQYYATLERTRYQVGETTEPSAMVEWDFTPVYIMLVILTLAYALYGYLHRQKGHSGRLETASDPGGTA